MGQIRVQKRQGNKPADQQKLVVRYVDVDGVQRDKSAPFFNTPEGRKACQKYLDALEEGIAELVRIAREAGGGPLTVRSYGRKWINERIAAEEKTSAKGYNSDLERLIYPCIVETDGATLGDMLVRDVRPRHVATLVRTLKKTPSRQGGFLAPRTICNAHGTLHTMFENARTEGVIPHDMPNPCKLAEGILPERTDKDPTFRSKAVFNVPEVELLISRTDVIPQDRIVIYAIEFLAACRWGEMSGLRWLDWDTTTEPLGTLSVAKSFSRIWKREKSTKTGKQRLVPVIPTLAAILSEWKLGGWERMMGRPPRPEDLIVPNGPVLEHSSGVPFAPELQRAECKRVRELPFDAVEHYRLSGTGLERFHRDCAELGLRARRNHDTKRTARSLLIKFGARDPVLRYLIWGPTKKVEDLYTTIPWETFCEEMTRYKIERRVPVVVKMPVAKVANLHGQDSSEGVQKGYNVEASVTKGESEWGVQDSDLVGSIGTNLNSSEKRVSTPGNDSVLSCALKLSHRNVPSQIGETYPFAKGTAVRDGLLEALRDWDQDQDAEVLRWHLKALLRSLPLRR